MKVGLTIDIHISIEKLFSAIVKNNKFINWTLIELFVSCSLIHSLLPNGHTYFKNLAVFTPQVCLAVFQPLREKCPYSEFFWSAFSRVRTEYEGIRSICPYSVRMLENTDQKNSEDGRF